MRLYRVLAIQAKTAWMTKKQCKQQLTALQMHLAWHEVSRSKTV